LVNSDFWLAFGSFLVLGIIYYIISMVFSLPAIIYSFVKIGISANEIDPSNMDDLVDPFYIFLNVLSSFIQFVLNIVLIIGGALIYFHLNEKKNFTGTYERIDKIGENLNG
jgi:predicted RND superfamily exporter protein